MQRPHSFRHLLVRGAVAAASQATMCTGLYPFVPFAVRSARSETPGATLRGVMHEWCVSVAVSAARPWGFWPLPGALNQGPRPIIVLHGYAMNRAGFIPLASQLAAHGLGPLVGFEYWTFGRTAVAAQQLGQFVEHVRASTGADTVDIIGHSMGGVVGLYYVQLAGGDRHVANLITIGSPISGTDVSAFGIGHPGRELRVGSKLVARLAVSPPPAHTKITTIWSTADVLVPGALQRPVPGADLVMYDELGHVGMLGSRRVSNEVLRRLR